MTILLHTYTHEAVFSLHGVIDVLLCSLTDTLKMLPFLFLAFLMIEYLEHKAQEKIKHIFKSAGITGPLIGTVLGCIPQCGFSVMSANLYSSGIIALGTLIAVFLATSDEAIILLAAAPNGAFEVLRLLIAKIVIALVFGYIIYAVEKKCSHKHEHHHHSHDLCEHDRCGCEESGSVLKPALIHTVKVFFFLFLFTFIIDFSSSLLGMDKISSVLLSNSAFQPLLSALIGFIPNCASSVLLTQLYISGTLSFGSLIAGLCTNAGAGMLILFRNKKKIKDNIKILGILYICSVIPGIILHTIL